MSLVDYDSDQEEEEENNPVKRQRAEPESAAALPPPPKKLILDKKSICQDNTSADHEGRVRSFPHVDGQWATYVYLPGRAFNMTLSL